MSVKLIVDSLLSNRMATGKLLNISNQGVINSQITGKIGIKMSTTFISELNRLKNIQINLEKNEQILLQHLKKYEVSKVVDLHEELEIERGKELNLIRIETINILNPLSKYRTLTSSAKELENLDYKQVKKEMISLTDNIKSVNCKIKQHLAKLKSDEKQFCNEVKVYESKIAEWEKHISLAPSNLNNTNGKVDQTTTDFLTFLSKNGGHTNGWSSDDHNLFLKVRSKCKHIDQVCTYLHALLPDISEEHIELHEKWYIQYLDLRDKQKQAIQVWRKAKSAVLPHKKPLKDTKRIASAYNQTINLSRQEIKEKLQKWKQEKMEKLQHEKVMKEELEKHRQEIDQKNKERLEQIKKNIQSWKLAKLEEEESRLYEKHSLEKEKRLFKSAMANRLIKEFQSQDAVFIKRRLESCNYKPKLKTTAKVTNNVNVTRDPSRLLKPTKQWASRIKIKEVYKNIRVPGTVKTIPRLGIPAWRKSVSITR